MPAVYTSFPVEARWAVARLPRNMHKGLRSLLVSSGNVDKTSLCAYLFFCNAFSLTLTSNIAESQASLHVVG